MFAKPMLDTRRIARFTDRMAGLAEMGQRLRTALPAMPRPADADAPRPAWFPDLKSASNLDAASIQANTAPAMREMLDRLAKLNPGSPLCGMTASGQRHGSVAVPDGARFAEFTFQGSGGTIGYKLYVPSTYCGQDMPLVVMLHGCTQSPDDFAAGTRMNDLAEEQGILVAYPRQTSAANAQRCWNWFDAKDQSRDRGEPALIAGLTREILRDFAVDPARVYVAGLSAGGAAASIMAQAYPDLYAAAGVHSGLASGAAADMPSAFAAMRQGGSVRACGGLPRPTIVFHGDLDRTVHPINGDHVVLQAKGGAALTASVEQGRAQGGLSYTRTVHSDAAGQGTVESWVLHGAGHAWSGGSAAGSYTEPRGPDASREMLRFFLQQAGGPIVS